jgi:hypothetical protein
VIKLAARQCQVRARRSRTRRRPAVAAAARSRRPSAARRGPGVRLRVRRRAEHRLAVRGLCALGPLGPGHRWRQSGALCALGVLGPGRLRRAETAPAAERPHGSVIAVDLGRSRDALLPGLYTTFGAVHQGLQCAPQPRPTRRARAPPCACAAPARRCARRRPQRHAVLASDRPSGRSYSRARAFVRPSARALARAPVAPPAPPTSPRGPRSCLARRHARESKTNL